MNGPNHQQSLYLGLKTGTRLNRKRPRYNNNKYRKFVMSRFWNLTANENLIESEIN